MGVQHKRKRASTNNEGDGGGQTKQGEVQNKNGEVKNGEAQNNGEAQHNGEQKNGEENQETPHIHHTMNSTPWSYWTEWNTVYSLLFSEKLEERREGVMRVSTWRSRGVLPVSVECTAALAEVVLLDADRSASLSLSPDLSNHALSIHSMKLLYSSGITRLVNGILDAKQQLAAENSFPQLLVDLRHQASHFAELPSIHVLRTAAELGLQWLQAMYWERQTNSLMSLQQLILQTLLKYKHIMHIPVRDRLFDAAVQSHSSVAKVSSLVRIAEVKRCIEEITTIPNPNLVQEVLVPLLVSLTAVEGGHHFMLPPGKYAGTGVPQELILLWHIALRKFTHVWSHFPIALMLALVNQVIESCGDQITFEKGSNEYEMNALRTAWVAHIIRNYYPILHHEMRAKKDGGRATNAILSIANICLKNMNIWTKQILSSIIKHNSGNEKGVGEDTQWESLKEISELRKLADTLRNRHRVDKKNLHKDEPESILVSIDILERAVNTNGVHSATTSGAQQPEKIWARSHQYPTSTPLGVLPTGEFPDLDLPVSLDNFQHATFVTLRPPNVPSPPLDILSSNNTSKNEIQDNVIEESNISTSIEVADIVDITSELEKDEMPARHRSSPSNVGSLFSAYKDLFS